MFLLWTFYFGVDKQSKQNDGDRQKDKCGNRPVSRTADRLNSLSVYREKAAAQAERRDTDRDKKAR